jgi:hypothetical protein
MPDQQRRQGDLVITYGYSNIFRTFVEGTGAADRQLVVDSYSGLPSPALAAFTAELAAYSDDRPPRFDRYYSPDMPRWLVSADADLRTEAGHRDMVALMFVETSPATTTPDEALHRGALGVLLWEWRTWLAIGEMGAMEVDVDEDINPSCFGFIEYPRTHPPVVYDGN